MEKLKRNERIGILVYILTDKPNHVFTYNYFCDLLNAAKSTISEDIAIVKETIEKFDFGYIETLSGAAGGVRFIPKLKEEDIKEFLHDVSKELSLENRIIPGGFIYMTDVLYSPNIIRTAGRIFAQAYKKHDLDYVVTVETKGIPIALMTADILDVPLVIIRRNTKVTEGSTVTINYISGSTGKIQTMSLSRRAIKEGSKVLIIDDFMKAGGTLKGIKDMMLEFNVNVMGTGVFMSTEDPSDKLVEDYLSLLKLKSLDTKSKEILIEPNGDLFEVVENNAKN